MFDYLKLPGSLFFILFAFAFTNSAQTLNENKPSDKEIEKSFTDEYQLAGDAAKQSPFAANRFGRESKDSRKTEKGNQEQTVEPDDWRPKRGDKSFTIEYGISPFNPSNFSGPKSFDVYGRDLHLFSVRAGRILGTKNNVSYEYMFGASPLAIFTRNEVVNPAFVSAAATPFVAPTKRETTYGIGIQPVNFKFMFFAKNRLKPYAQVGAGLLFTNKDVPVPRATRLNLTGDFGGGLMYMLTGKRAVSFGYKYFHISNGKGLDNANNPGYNANVFYINYSFLCR